MGGNPKKEPKKTPKENKILGQQIKRLFEMNARLLRENEDQARKIKTLTGINFRSKELEELLDRQNWPDTSFVEQTKEELLKTEFVKIISLMGKQGFGFYGPKGSTFVKIIHALRRRATLKSKRGFWELVKAILEDIHNINIQNMTGEASADLLLDCVAALEAIIDQTDLLQEIERRRGKYVFNPESEFYKEVFPQSVPIPR